MPLYIDNELMPEPAFKGIVFSDEKIWHSNTGRATSALMQGSIKGLKQTRSLKFPPLTSAEKDKLNAKVNDIKKQWHTLKYVDAYGTTLVSFECYFGTPTYTLYSGAKDLRYFTDYSVDVIER